MSSVASDMSVSANPLIDQLRSAIEHHQSGRFEMAESGYRNILQAAPAHPDASHNLGLLLLGRGECDAALPYLNTALEAQPDNPQCWLSYAEGLLYAGRADEARQVILIGRESGLEGAAADLLEARITVAWAARPDLAGLRRLAEAGAFESMLQQAREQMLRFGEDIGLMNMLAEALMHLGRESEALPWLEKVCATAADPCDAWLMRGDVLGRLEDFEAAYRAYLKALALRPNDPEIFALLGENLKAAGFLEESFIWLRHAVLGGVRTWRAWQQLNAILCKAGGSDNALLISGMTNNSPPVGDQAIYLLRVLEVGVKVDALPKPRKRLAKAPGSDVRNRLKNFLANRQMDQAFELAIVLSETYPLDAFGWKVLGALLKVQGLNSEMAVIAMLLSVAADPEDLEASVNLSKLYTDAGRYPEAEAAAQRALSLRPDFLEGQVALANAQRCAGKYIEAREQYLKILALAPVTYAGRSFVLNNLGHVLGMLGDLDGSIKNYRAALSLQPESDVVFSNLLFALSHHAELDMDTLFAEHCRYGAVFEAPLRSSWPQHKNVRNPERTLKVGFVSGDLKNHAVANFIEPILLQLAEYASMKLYAYSNNPTEDDVSMRLRGYFAYWQRVDMLGNSDLADKIEADGIDILIDLSGHTAKNRLFVFAHKPAPIQVSWIGYQGTTGLRAMDYYISDRFTLPLKQFEDKFTEKLMYLPAVAPFLPFDGAPDVNELPALKKGHLTFGSFNRLDKVNSATIALWGQLLSALPQTRMLIGGLPPDFNHDVLIEAFSGHGVVRERLDFYPRATMADYLALHHKVDICLDCYPYAGGTTSLHALWMGVPTLSIVGDTPASRTGAALAGQFNLVNFAASDVGDFVSKGVAWAGAVSELAEIRAKLRSEFEQSALRHPDVIAACLESALRIAWRHWCDGKEGESIEVKMSDLATIGGQQ